LDLATVFRPGFLLGGFSAEQNIHMVLCLNRILQKNRFPEVLCVFGILQEQKTQKVCSLGNFPLCGNLNTAGAVLPGTTSSKEQ
jgi:hypothetical protein